MGKGVLLELAGREAVVLTPQGEFRRVPAPKGSWDIGDEVEFAEVRPSAPWARLTAVAAAAAVMVLAPLGWQTYTLAQPAAIVTMDINPSLQMTLNKIDQVLKVEALNPDGAQVLEGVQWKRQPVAEVVAAVTTQAVARQKLNLADQSGAVVVGVVPMAQVDLPKAQADRIRDKAYTAVASVAPDTNVAVLEVTAEEKAAAASVGLSPGKFVILQTLQDAGVSVSPEDLNQKGPGSILKELNVSPSFIFSQAEKEHGGSSDKSKSKNGSDDQPVAPATGQPDDTGKKSDDEPKGDDKSGKDNSRPDDNSGKGNGKADDVKPSGNSGNSGNGNGSEPKKDDAKKDDAKKDESKKDEPKKDDSKKDDKKDDKKGTWTVPLIGITIEKPAFLRDKNDLSQGAGDSSPAASTPRAETPGAAGASDNKGKGSDKPGKEKEQEEEQEQEKEREKEREKEQEKEQSGQKGKGK